MGSSPAPLPGPHPRRGHGIPVFPWLSSLTPWQPGGGVSTLSLPSRALGPPHVGGCAAGQGRPGVPKIPPGALFILHTHPSWGPASASPDPSGLWSRPCVVGRRGSQLPLLTVGVCVCASRSPWHPPSAAIPVADPQCVCLSMPQGFSPHSPTSGSLPPPLASRPGVGGSRCPLLAPLTPRVRQSAPSILFPTVQLVFWKARGLVGGALSAIPGRPSIFFFTNAGSLQEACFVPDELGVPEGAALEGLPASSPGSFCVPCLFPRAPNPPGPGSRHTPLLLSSDFTLGSQRCCCWSA